MSRPPPGATLFPYTTLFRSRQRPHVFRARDVGARGDGAAALRADGRRGRLGAVAEIAHDHARALAGERARDCATDAPSAPGDDDRLALETAHAKRTLTEPSRV